MIRLRQRVRLVCAFLLLSLILVACGSSSEEPTSQASEPMDTGETETATATPEIEPTEVAPAERPELTIRLRNMDMEQLDPAFLSRDGDVWLANNILNTLVRWKTGTPEIEPDLAESWEVSDDGKEITFHLREGVMWHKGYGEVTAEDVKFSMDRYIDPDLGSPFYSLMENIQRVEVIDKYTVKIVIDVPTPTFLTSVLPFKAYIIPKAAFEELGQEQFALNPIGSGPFIFDHWTTGTEVLLLANDEYYSGPPQISALRLLPIVEDAVATVALQTGEIGFMLFETSEAYDILSQDPEITIIKQPRTAGRYLWLDTQEPPLDNVLVRRALAHALNLEEISEFGFDGVHPAMHTILPPSLLCWTDDVPKYEYDPDMALQLLEEAGYPDGFDLTLLYSQREPSQIIAEMVQDSWREIGVNLEITGLEHATYTEIRRGPELRKDFDIIQSHTGRNTDPHSFLIETLHSSAFPPGGNASYYTEVDALLDAGAAEFDDAARCEIYREVQEKIQTDLPVIPVLHSTALYAARNDVQGFIPGFNNEFWAYPFYVVEE